MAYDEKYFPDILEADKNGEVLFDVKELPFYEEEEFQRLTPIQQKFILGYMLKDLAGWSLERCYDFASPTENQKKLTLNVSAVRLQTHPKVAPYLRQVERLLLDKFGDIINTVMKQELSIASADILDYLDDDMTITPENLKKLPKTVSAAIKKIEITEIGGVVKYKIETWDKGAALGRLEKIQGMYAPEKVINTNINADIDEKMSPQEAANTYSQLLKGDSGN